MVLVCSGSLVDCQAKSKPEIYQDFMESLFFNGKTRSFDWAMFKLLNYQKVVGAHRIFIGVVLALHGQIVKAADCML